jgi:hypothetical protein
MVSVLVSVADSYATKPLPLKRFGMEARVGIGRLTPCLRGKFTPLRALFQYTPALLSRLKAQ